MKKLYRPFVAVIIAMTFCIHGYSQSSFMIRAGGSLPLSDFGDESMHGAAVGLNIGATYLYKPNEKGLGFYIGADMNYNGFKESYKETFEELFSTLGINVSDITYSKYINIPVRVGLYYSVLTSDRVSLFLDAGAGANFLKVTDMTLGGPGIDYTFYYDLSKNLAYQFGGGLFINDTYSIGLHYTGTGEHTVSGTMDDDGTESSIEDLAIKVSLLSLSFGIKF